MGIDFNNDEIELVRDPQEQVDFGVSKDYIPEFTGEKSSGHAYHTYSLTSADKTVQF